MEWNKVMNFGDPSTFGTEMADRFVASGANLPPPVSNRVKTTIAIILNCFLSIVWPESDLFRDSFNSKVDL